MLMNDGRECAKQVNKMLATKAATYKVEGAVEVYDDAYLFGHYDSRGGASLVVGAGSGLRACISYNRGCGWPDLGGAALEDLLTPTGCEVHFVGRKPEPDQELQYGFEDAERGYLYARVWTRWRGRTEGRGEWSSWEAKPVWVFFPVPDDWDVPNETTGVSLADLWDDCAQADLKFLPKLKPFMPKIERAMPWVLEEQVQLRPDNLGEDACGVGFYLCGDLTNIDPNPEER